MRTISVLGGILAFLSSAENVSHAFRASSSSLTPHTASPSTAKDMTSTQETAGAVREDPSLTKTSVMPITAEHTGIPIQLLLFASFAMMAMSSTKTPCAKLKIVPPPILT